MTKHKNTVSWTVAKAWNDRYKKQMKADEYKQWLNDFIESTIIYTIVNGHMMYASSTQYIMDLINKGEKQPYQADVMLDGYFYDTQFSS